MTNQRPGEAGSDQSEAGRLESESERGAGNISPSQTQRGRPGCREEIYLWYVWLKITAPLPKRKTFSKL